MPRYTFYYDRRIRGEVDGETTSDALANVRYGMGNIVIEDESEDVDVQAVSERPKPPRDPGDSPF